jgi:hypothetical protein
MSFFIKAESMLELFISVAPSQRFLQEMLIGGGKERAWGHVISNLFDLDVIH